MGGSLRLFTFRGIQVKVHSTFALILIWGAVQWGWLAGRGLAGAAFGVVVTLLLFACVTLHEFGHALTAQAFGVRTRDITLWPFGGVARLERIPDKPLQELAIALAGPAVNVVIMLALALAGGLAFMGKVLQFGAIRAALDSLSPAGMALYLLAMNFYLAVFNLIPAFPMDGGRVLRALLALRLQYSRATAIAVGVGQAFAALLGLGGVLGGGVFLVIVAVFIYMGAGQEGALVQVKSVLGEVKVKQAYSRQAQAIGPQDTLQRPVDITLTTFQSDFPVCDGDRLVGLLTRTDLLRALHRAGPSQRVADVMRTEFPRASPDDGLFAAQQALSESGLEAAPVVEGGKFRGLLTVRDIQEIYRLISASPELLTTGAGSP